MSGAACHISVKCVSHPGHITVAIPLLMPTTVVLSSRRSRVRLPSGAFSEPRGYGDHGEERVALKGSVSTRKTGTLVVSTHLGRVERRNCPKNSFEYLGACGSGTLR